MNGIKDNIDNNIYNNNKMNSLNIGLVVHGPEMIDSGYAKKILSILEKFSNEYSINLNIKAKLGGTMGRVAVIDNNLDDVIDISEKLVPSESLKKLGNNDILILMNYGKSKETGHTFGKIVVGRSNVPKPIIQIERPGEKDGTILLWNKNEHACKILDLLLNYLSEKLNLSVEECISDGLDVWEENGIIFRKLHGVDEGEPIMINGIVIGRARGKSVVLVAKNGKLLKIINGELKEHGVEKLGSVDLKKAIVKTGILRRHPSNIDKNRDMANSSNKSSIYKISKNNTKKEESNQSLGDIIIVNHAGENVLEKIKNKNVSAVITIGDDTTIICGDILARFGIKIIGITDGDRDEILKNPIITEGSAIFLIKNCKDDEVGYILQKKLKNKKMGYNQALIHVKEILDKNNVEYIIFKEYPHNNINISVL
jgi:hypothetical protein